MKIIKNKIKYVLVFVCFGITFAQDTDYNLPKQYVKPYLNENLSTNIHLLSSNIFYYGQENTFIEFSIKNTYPTTIGGCLRTSFFIYDYKTSKIIPYDSLRKGQWTSEGSNFDYSSYSKSCVVGNDMNYVKMIKSNDSLIVPANFFSLYPVESVKPGRYKIIFRMPFDNLGYAEKSFDIIIKNYKEPDYTLYKNAIKKVENNGFKPLQQNGLIDFIYSQPNNIYFKDACERIIQGSGFFPIIEESKKHKLKEQYKKIMIEYYNDTLLLRKLFSECANWTKLIAIQKASDMIHYSNGFLYTSSEPEKIKIANKFLRQISHVEPIYSSEFIKYSSKTYNVNKATLINYAEKRCKKEELEKKK